MLPSYSSWRTLFKKFTPLKTSWKIVYWSPIGLVFSQYYYKVNVISGRSMQPTLNPDSSNSRDVAIFDRYSVFASQDYKRDDIVTLRCPTDPTRILIKRILAVEGDTVETLPPYHLKLVHVPAGHVWVEGDEPFYSDDSNLFGPVPRALIESKLMFLIWPPSRFGSTNNSPELPVMNAGSAFRYAKAASERERARHERVKIS